MLTRRYWQPFQEIEAMRRQFDQLFDDLITTGSDRPTWVPVVELHDTGDAFTLRAQLPGIEAKDLDVQVSQDAVAISGEQRQESRQEDKGVIHSEFRYGRFHRVVRLPAAVLNDQVQAEYKDGILNLTLPKVQEARNQVVKINLGNKNAPISASEPATDAAN